MSVLINNNYYAINRERERKREIRLKKVINNKLKRNIIYMLNTY